MAVTIGRTADTDDDGSGTTGTIHNDAWKTEFYDQIDTALALVAAPDTRASVWYGAAQSIADNTASTLAFDNEDYDTAAMHDNASNNSRITVPATGGYLVTARVSWAPATGGARSLAIGKNGTQIRRIIELGTLTGGLSFQQQLLSVVVEATAADYFQVIVYQNTGGALNAGDGGASRLDANDFSATRLW